MFKKRKADNSGEFLNKEYCKEKINKEAEYDLCMLFEKSNEEMVAQQAKRDQIISLFLAIFSFVVPFALSMEGIDTAFKGLIFLAIAIIGVLFSLVIIRYRLYKESYWLCCQTLTSLMSFKQKELNKETIQAVYYQCMKKKFKKYVDDKVNPPKFKRTQFYLTTLYSGETILYVVQAFMTALTAGLSILFLCSHLGSIQYVFASVGAILVLIWLVNMFLSELMHAYDVLVYDTNASFNKTYSRAWFLHFFV